jgi:formiminotetrahydrofolate cyclodeaminase
MEARRAGDEQATLAAWRRAARVPADVVRLSREVAQLACRAAHEGPPSTLGDAAMAALLAAAAGAGSQVNVRLNVQAAGEPEDLRALAEGSETDLREAQRAAGETRLLVEERLGKGAPREIGEV